jgi:hypothetical protein
MHLGPWYGYYGALAGAGQPTGGVLVEVEAVEVELVVGGFVVLVDGAELLLEDVHSSWKAVMPAWIASDIPADKP